MQLLYVIATNSAWRTVLYERGTASLVLMSTALATKLSSGSPRPSSGTSCLSRIRPATSTSSCMSTISTKRQSSAGHARFQSPWTPLVSAAGNREKQLRAACTESSPACASGTLRRLEQTRARQQLQKGLLHHTSSAPLGTSSTIYRATATKARFMTQHGPMSSQWHNNASGKDLVATLMVLKTMP